VLDRLALICFNKLIPLRLGQLSPTTTPNPLPSEALSKTPVVNVKTKAQVLALFQASCNAETNVQHDNAEKPRVSSDSNEIDIEDPTQWSSEMREEEENEETEEMSGVRIEADEVTGSMSGARIADDDVASGKRGIAETEEEGGVQLGEEEIRDSKRRATKAKLARLVDERRELEESLAENTRETERAERDLEE